MAFDSNVQNVFGTVVNTGVAADTHLHLFEVDATNGTSVLFSIDGTLVATIALSDPHMPAAGVPTSL